MSHPAVRREIDLPAAPHTVYRAWLTPEIMRRWFAPDSYECVRAEVDERVGGRFQIWHADAGRPAGGFDAEIVELVPDRRIVWRWAFVGPDRAADPAFDSRLTVTLAETADGGTRLTLLHEHLDALAEAAPEVTDQVGNGWESALHHLAVALKQ